jgi:uncharacterized protein (TIGR03435 family)
MRRIHLAFSILASAAAAFAQPPASLPSVSLPHFEVASIRLNASGETGSSNDIMASYVTFHNYTLRGIIRLAFMVDDLSLEAPAWVGDLRFDIMAKVLSESATLAERRQMLQALLYDRLALAVHRTSVMRAGFALVTAKGGARIAPVEDAGGHINDAADGNIRMLRTTMGNFAETPGFKLKQPVANETKLGGVFNVALTYAPDRGTGSPVGDGPSLFSALEEQLGLKLEPRKLPVDVLVVDHCERMPTEN